MTFAGHGLPPLLPAEFFRHACLFPSLRRPSLNMYGKLKSGYEPQKSGHSPRKLPGTVAAFLHFQIYKTLSVNFFHELGEAIFQLLGPLFAFSRLFCMIFWKFSKNRQFTKKSLFLCAFAAPSKTPANAGRQPKNGISSKCGEWHEKPAFSQKKSPQTQASSQKSAFTKKYTFLLVFFVNFALCNLLYFLPFHPPYSGIMAKT